MAHPESDRGGAGAAAGRWDHEVQRFAERDAAQPPPQGGIVFTGSSSIVLWRSLEQDFAGLPVINRGFGGATLRDVLVYADRVILPYAPGKVVVYAGSHDLHGEGAEPEQVRDTFRDLCDRIARSLPGCLVYFISLKPSIAKRAAIHLDRAVNALVRDLVASDPRVRYIDIWTPMLGPDGEPAVRYFAPDLNHLSRDGYRLWADVIRPHLA